jgi:hypothetical protein
VWGTTDFAYLRNKSCSRWKTYLRQNYEEEGLIDEGDSTRRKLAMARGVIVYESCFGGQATALGPPLCQSFL